jgi:hypothetical protein
MRHIVSADVNHDDRPDIIASFTTTLGFNLFSSLGRVDILFNNGDGTFTVQTILDCKAFAPVSVVTNDFNGDDKLDIIILNGYLPEIQVLLNSVNGTFTEQRNFFTGNMSLYMTAADINNDNKSDIIILNYVSQDIRILFNTDNGTFMKQVNYNTGCYPYHVITADLNNDDRLDIILACGCDIILFYNDGNGRFAPYEVIDAVLHTVLLAAMDINDLIVRRSGGQLLAFYLNIGNGRFAAPTTYPVVTVITPFGIAVEDVNGDKKADVVLADFNSITILFNMGNGTFTTQQMRLTGDLMSGIALNDVNNDSQLDIIVGTDNSIGIFYTYCD